MTAVALISELMTQSQVSAAADRAGVELVFVSTADALAAKVDEQPPGLVIVDLSHPGIDPRSLVERLKPLLPADATTVAFGPHVHKAQLAAATEAGFGQVMSRGEFHAQAEALLRRHGS